MRILVTGAAGFIGTVLCQELVAAGHQVVGVDCFLEDSYSARVKRENAARLSTYSAVKMVDVDLRDQHATVALPAVDAVVHLAAMPGLVKSWLDVDLYFSCNTIATSYLASWAASIGVQRFVFSSTSSVYGTLATSPENGELHPASPYGVSKLAAEHILKSTLASSSVELCILRYYSVYGPGQRPDMAYNRICRALLEDSVIEIYGDGHQSRTNTYVEDIVEGTILALNSNFTGIANLSGLESITLLDSIKILADELGKSPRLAFLPARRGDQRETRGNISTAQNAFGYNPSTPLEQGLRRQAQWQMAQI